MISDFRESPPPPCPAPSFHTPQGVLLWAAWAAHWFLWNQVKQQAALPNRESFLAQWLRLRKKKKRRTLARKQWLAVDAKKIINQLEEEGWNLVFTDGSAKHHPKIGWVAGYGCVWMGKWETKGYLHPSTATMWMNSKQSSQYYHISKPLMSG